MKDTKMANLYLLIKKMKISVEKIYKYLWSIGCKETFQKYGLCSRDETFNANLLQMFLTGSTKNKICQKLYRVWWEIYIFQSSKSVRIASKTV